jgi:hypothetical protein
MVQGVFDNDYTPTLLSEDGQTPTLSTVIMKAIEAALLETHTWLPALVVAVRPTGQVDLQPLLLRRYKTLPAPVPLPIIQNCLVVQPRGTLYGIKLPVQIGDTGVALFCERSLDKWSLSGGAVDPMDVRHHDLSDAVFVPGLYPLSQPVPPPVGADPTTLVVYNGVAQLWLEAQGGFKMTNGPAELMTLLGQLTAQLTTLVTTLVTAPLQLTTTPGNPTSPNPANVALFAPVLTQLTLIQTALTTLTGV